MSAVTPAVERAVAWAGVRGKPSRSQPFSMQSDSLRRSLTYRRESLSDNYIHFAF